MSARGAGFVDTMVVVAMVVVLVVGASAILGRGMLDGSRCLAMRIGFLKGSCAAADGKLAAPTTGAHAQAAAPGMICDKMGCTQTACFAAGTLVATPSGLRPIESIDVGDDVIGAGVDVPGGVRALQHRVLATKLTRDRELLALSLSRGDAPPDLLLVTREHPFYELSRSGGPGWSAAGALAEGSVVATISGPATVTSTAETARREDVYNLEVEGVHTYLVGAYGAVVHNDYEPPESDPQGDWTSKTLQLPPRNMQPQSFEKGKPDPMILNGLVQGSINWGDAMPLAKAPKSMSGPQQEALAGLKGDVDAAFGELKAARDAMKAFQRANESKYKQQPSGGWAYSADVQGEYGKLVDAAFAGARKYHEALGRYFMAVDTLKKGGDIKYTPKQVGVIAYQGGGSAKFEWEGDRIKAVTFAQRDGSRLRVYDAGRGEWRIDIGKGKDDLLAFRGSYTLRQDGALVRETDTRTTTIRADGHVEETFKKREYHELKSDLAGGIKIVISLGDDGVAMTVGSSAANMVSTVNRFKSWKGDVAPRIVKTEGDVLFISFDGTENAHVAVRVTKEAWGKGLAWTDRRVPYYDEKNLRAVLRDLPAGTEQMKVEIASAKASYAYTWISPLPADTNFLIPNHGWQYVQKPGGGIDPRMGWRRNGQFVTDYTDVDRRWGKFVDAYISGMARGAPFVGGLVMVGEAATGSKITGESMGTRERMWHGAFGVLAVGLDFGPLVYEGVQGAKTLAELQKATGLSKAEAEALMRATNSLSEVEKGALKQVAKGEAVAPATMEPILRKLDEAVLVARAGGGDAAARSLLGSVERGVVKPAASDAPAQVQAFLLELKQYSPEVRAMAEHQIQRFGASRGTPISLAERRIILKRTVEIEQLMKEMGHAPKLKGADLLKDPKYVEASSALMDSGMMFSGFNSTIRFTTHDGAVHGGHVALSRVIESLGGAERVAAMGRIERSAAIEAKLKELYKVDERIAAELFTRDATNLLGGISPVTDVRFRSTPRPEGQTGPLTVEQAQAIANGRASGGLNSTATTVADAKKFYPDAKQPLVVFEYPPGAPGVVINGEGLVTEGAILYRTAMKEKGINPGGQNPEGFVPNEIMVGTPKDGKWLVESIRLESGVYVVKLKPPTATPIPVIPGAPKPATPLPVPRGTTPPIDEKKPPTTSRRPGLRPGMEVYVSGAAR